MAGVLTTTRVAPACRAKAINAAAPKRPGEDAAADGRRANHHMGSPRLPREGNHRKATPSIMMSF
jgi:hypothetical protein